LFTTWQVTDLLDIPDKLHRAIKGKAALEGKAMVDMLRELLEEKYL
jgi:hypothetical protein